MTDDRNILVVTGGIGGAKLVLGLSQIVPPKRLTAIVNTGDDFRHLGLHVSPDIDTLIYTLSGLADKERGWGRGDESWNFMESLRQIGGDDWFNLGDRDLALHVERTRRLAAGQTLTEITAHFARQLGVGLTILPMADQPVATRVVTDDGEIAFQDYFVRQRTTPVLRAVRFAGAEDATLTEGVISALEGPALGAILIAPSNPWLSVDPVLSVPGMREALRAANAPVVVVTPLPGGQAVKGPTAKIMGELGIALSAHSIEDHYRGLADAILLDTADPAIGTRHAFTDTWMHTLEDRVRVARAALDLAFA